MTAPQTPVPAAMTAAPAAGSGPSSVSATTGRGAVADTGLSDVELFARMLADDTEIDRLLDALRDRHSMDLSGPVLAAMSRIHVSLDMIANELRLIRNYMGGQP